jgi:hypothetical protein
MNGLIAARRTFRVLGLLPPSVSNEAKKSVNHVEEGRLNQRGADRTAPSPG